MRNGQIVSSYLKMQANKAAQACCDNKSVDDEGTKSY